MVLLYWVTVASHQPPSRQYRFTILPTRCPRKAVMRGPTVFILPVYTHHSKHSHCFSGPDPHFQFARLPPPQQMFKVCHQSGATGFIRPVSTRHSKHSHCFTGPGPSFSVCPSTPTTAAVQGVPLSENHRFHPARQHPTHQTLKALQWLRAQLQPYVGRLHITIIHLDMYHQLAWDDVSRDWQGFLLLKQWMSKASLLNASHGRHQTSAMGLTSCLPSSPLIRTPWDYPQTHMCSHTLRFKDR